MNRRSFIHSCYFIAWILIAQNCFSQTTSSNDTTITENVAKEDTLISELVKSKTVPKKDKIQYFSQVTKYGFKNLFSHYDYDPSMPYTAQVNPNAENFVQDYMRSHGSYLQKMKGWGQPYFTLIENILQQYGLPRELKYVAVIESNLKTRALSNKGASGPWQLMPGTARRLGLTINNYIDERTDYYKSTNAAARYLLSLYSQFHDWLLVMAAYNGGAGCVSNAIIKCKSNDFWNLQFYLPEESRNYVKRFIATHYIMEGSGWVDSSNDLFANNSNDVTFTSYKQISGPNPYNSKPALSVTEKNNLQVLTISGKYNSVVIAKDLSMDMSLFDHYNPNMDKILSTIGNYDLRLPSDKMNLFVTNKYLILNESVQVLLRGFTIPDRQTVYPKKHSTVKNKSQ